MLSLFIGAKVCNFMWGGKIFTSLFQHRRQSQYTKKISDPLGQLGCDIGPARNVKQGVPQLCKPQPTFSLTPNLFYNRT